jgi:hypothetical protein
MVLRGLIRDADERENHRKYGKELSGEDVARAHERKRVYAKWLRESVFGGDGFNTIMVYPVGDIIPFYRDVYRKSVAFPTRHFAGERKEAHPINRDPLDVKPSYSWNEREDHQASLAGIPSMVIPGILFSTRLLPPVNGESALEAHMQGQSARCHIHRRSQVASKSFRLPFP